MSDLIQNLINHLFLALAPRASVQTYAEKRFCDIIAEQGDIIRLLRKRESAHKDFLRMLDFDKIDPKFLRLISEGYRVVDFRPPQEGETYVSQLGNILTSSKGFSESRIIIELQSQHPSPPAL